MRVDRSATQDWGLDELDIEVLRVRHPLPACARMVVTRPVLVILGQEVRSVDIAFVKRVAREINAKVVQLGPRSTRTSFRGWVEWALDAASEQATPRAACRSREPRPARNDVSGDGFRELRRLGRG